MDANSNIATNAADLVAVCALMLVRLMLVASTVNSDAGAADLDAAAVAAQLLVPKAVLLLLLPHWC